MKAPDATWQNKYSKQATIPWSKHDSRERYIEGSRFASRSPTEILTIVRTDFPSFVHFLVAREIRYRAARLRPRACLMPPSIDPRRAKLFSADPYVMRLHPLDEQHDRFACLHNAHNYWFSRRLYELAKIYRKSTIEQALLLERVWEAK